MGAPPISGQSVQNSEQPPVEFLPSKSDPVYYRLKASHREFTVLGEGSRVRVKWRYDWREEELDPADLEASSNWKRAAAPAPSEPPADDLSHLGWYGFVV